MTTETDTYDFGTVWCPTCNRTVVVHDRDTASRYTPRGEVSMPVLMLACTHTVPDGPETVTGPAPGAPYAGPGVAVAASARPADLRAARADDHHYTESRDQ